MNPEYTKPLPAIDEDNKLFWDYCKQHELRMQKCAQCEKLFYPPSAMCPHCQHMKFEWVKLSGKGKVFSYIIVRRAAHPGFAKEAPYVVAIIETAEGQRLTSNVIGCKPEDVRIEMPVEVVFEDVTKEVTLPKFKPMG
jgi:uncharacterized OB-fold protein